VEMQEELFNKRLMGLTIFNLQCKNDEINEENWQSYLRKKGKKK